MGGATVLLIALGSQLSELEASSKLACQNKAQAGGIKLLLALLLLLLPSLLLPPPPLLLPAAAIVAQSNSYYCAHVH